MADRILQHRRHRPRLHLLPPARHLPRLAPRNRRARLRARRQTLSLPPRQPSCPGPHLRRLHLRARQRAVAAHGLGRGLDHRARLGERVGEVGGGHGGDGAGVVWVRAVYYRDDWAAGYDTEY